MGCRSVRLAIAAVFDFGQGAEAVIFQLINPVWRRERLTGPIERHGRERHIQKYKAAMPGRRILMERGGGDVYGGPQKGTRISRKFAVMWATHHWKNVYPCPFAGYCGTPLGGQVTSLDCHRKASLATLPQTAIFLLS